MKRSFRHDFRRLLTGNFIAQLFLFSISPILSRMYTAEQFGIYAFYMSLLGVLLVISTFAFEKVIPLLENSKSIVNLCFIIAISWFLGGGLLYLITGFSLFSFAGETKPLIIWLFGIALLAASVQQFLTYEMMRQGKYDIISKSKIYQTFGNGSFQLGFANTSLMSVGLIAGDVVGRVLGAATAFNAYLKIGRKQKQNESILKSVQKYYKYPLFNTPSLLLNSLALQIPTFFFMVVLGAEDTGQFSFTQKLIGVPIAVLTTTLGQVFYGHASRLIREDSLALRALFRTTVKKVIMITAGPVLLFGLFAPTIFSTIFGAEWRLAGELARVMTPLFITQLAIIPVSQILYITTKLYIQLGWDSSRFIVLLVGFLILKNKEAEVLEMVLYYTVVMVVSYVLLYLLGSRILARREAQYSESL
ncbi:lipopolysaccharide biosynthesis protein [Listeria booriae]|uniref:lipopolysaccharide biosynthesis protein n=1 Tax=Listeria booriae TaxID=1552123 RepID=UPI001627D097|nr:oligosaccharide flippase family protein [Listeria booriae]MBC2676734.1 oligosaccharide flippase family protein [Listeria booriae]